jgi:hypothetical protein
MPRKITKNFSQTLTFNGLYGVISQKIVLFIITAVRTSNPTTSVRISGLRAEILTRDVPNNLQGS